MLVVTISVERKSFKSALLLSNGFTDGVSLGKIINQRTQSGDKVLVLSPDFKRYFEVFTGYYADRQIDYEIISEKNFPQEYKVIVAIPSRDTPKVLIDILQQHYKMTKIDQFIVFDLDEPTQKSLYNYPSL